jgi:hypothetical protein
VAETQEAHYVSLGDADAEAQGKQGTGEAPEAEDEVETDKDSFDDGALIEESDQEESDVTEISPRGLSRCAEQAVASGQMKFDFRAWVKSAPQVRGPTQWPMKTTAPSSKTLSHIDLATCRTTA